MVLKEAYGYHVGQRGLIDVLDSEGNRRSVQGEIIRLLQTPEETIYALIRTPTGTGLYRIL